MVGQGKQPRRRLTSPVPAQRHRSGPILVYLGTGFRICRLIPCLTVSPVGLSDTGHSRRYRPGGWMMLRPALSEASHPPLSKARQRCCPELSPPKVGITCPVQSGLGSLVSAGHMPGLGRVETTDACPAGDRAAHVRFVRGVTLPASIVQKRWRRPKVTKFEPDALLTMS